MFDSNNFLSETFYTYCGLPCIYTAGEFALVSSPLFREHRLRLYRQRTSLIDRFSRPFIMVSYLIVKGRTPVMRLRIDFDHAHGFFDHSEPDQPPIYLIFAPDMANGRVEQVLSCLERRLREPGVPDWPDCTYISLPVAAVCRTMIDLRMIRKSTVRAMNHIWQPTDYGASLGLTDGYMIMDDGTPLHTLFIPAERRMELYQALTWPRACLEEPQSVISLEQRLEQARQGLPCCNASAVGPVRAFGAIPMADYMSVCPETAEELRQQFGEMATFQEASDRIYQFCMTHTTPNDCIEFIACLILPLVLIYDKPDPVNQATRPVQKLMRMPFPSLLMGAAMAARQPCLLRNTRLILDDSLEGNQDKLQTTCWTLLRSLRGGSEEAGTVLLFRLFVEPFALLNQTLNVSCH